MGNTKSHLSNARNDPKFYTSPLDTPGKSPTPEYLKEKTYKILTKYSRLDPSTLDTPEPTFNIYKRFTQSSSMIFSPAPLADQKSPDQTAPEAFSSNI
jgi:hypothetical protein